jgi:hypothetical protein
VTRRLRAAWAAVFLLAAYAVPHRLIEMAQFHDSYVEAHAYER